MGANFVLASMGYLRYFIPLVKHFDNSIFFYYSGRKYDKANLHIEELTFLSKKFGFSVYPIEEINKYPSDLTFFIEGSLSEEVRYPTKKVSFTCQTDFTVHYKKYVDRMDYIVFPSKYIAEYYGCISSKNLYLGSSKYNINLCRTSIVEKYKLEEKNALVIFPRIRDIHKINLLNIYKELSEMGYNIIVKGRGKEPIPRKYRTKHSYEDLSWFPHPTLEFIVASDIVINFGSTAIEECIMLNTPIVNFDIKPFDQPLAFLYDKRYCINFKGFNDRLFRESILNLTQKDLSSSFKESRDKYLFEAEGASERIIEGVLN